MRVVFALTVSGCLGLLTCAVWPGVLEDALLALPFILVTLPLLGCWIVLLVILGLRDLVYRRRQTIRQRRGLWSAVIMAATIGLLWFHVPQRLVFAIYRSEFERLAMAVPVGEYRVTPLSRRIGPYSIDQYGIDEHGDVFFRTHAGPDGIGPDEMSYGFTLRPNGRGTPFGAARYRQCHLCADWYAFSASDDWFDWLE